MFRRLLFLSAGSLALLWVTAAPGQVHAQFHRGGFHRGFHSGFTPAFHSGFSPTFHSGSGRFHSGFNPTFHSGFGSFGHPGFGRGF